MKAAVLPINPAITASGQARHLDAPLVYKTMRDPLVQIVVPVLNEEKILAQSIQALQAYMTQHSRYRFFITIADNGSTDATREIAKQLSATYQNVELLEIPQRGRGRALKQAWYQSHADIVSYMDVDLSTDLADFLPMVEPLIRGSAGIGIGSRLARNAHTTRGLKRDTISRIYNKIIKLSAHTKFSDAQCGFKALRKDVANALLPTVSDNEWFFDTELLIKAERRGIPIYEQPVTWIEDTDSRVNVAKTATDDLKGLHRVSQELGEKTLLERCLLPLLLLATGALYFIGALHNGMANSYYSAAVQAASQSWTAWLFGSLDAANYVSIDKPPIATMIMGLSARLFGFSSLSMLLPNVLAGIGTVWLVCAAVRRQFGSKSAFIAGITMALTPVAVLMAGFNNPDMILTFFLAASAYSFLRSLEQKKPLLWLGLAALFTGFAFNTKMLQGLMVLPAMVIVYLIFAKPPLVKRIFHMLYAGIITAVSTLWWSILVWLTPANQRPWVGSTTDNNIWSLIFGYNGFGRLFGSGMGQGGSGASSTMGAMPSMASAANMATQTATNGTPPMGGGMGGPGGTGFGGKTGIFRMFNNDFGPNVGWLLPLALIGAVLMLWLLKKTPRENRGRAAVIFWLLWLLTHIVVFSMTSGVIHPYYVIAMAPAAAALIGISIPFFVATYKKRQQAGLLLPAVVAITAIVAKIILDYGTLAWLGFIIMPLGIIAAILLVIHFYHPNALLSTIGGMASTLAITLAPVSYAVATANVAHTGSIPTAGPSSTAMAASNNESSTISSALKQYLLSHQGDATWITAVASANQSAPIQLSTGQPVMAIGGFNGSDTPLTLAQFKALVAAGKVKYYAVSSKSMGGGGPGGGSNDITQWVQSNGTKVDYGGSDVTLYQLSA